MSISLDTKLTNDKAQMSNEVQSPNAKNWILEFDIRLKFACLPVGRDFDIWNL
jgi:hypothetical protein